MQLDNQRIAKNTLMLYFRMFLMMGVSLYTSRIILNTLGVEDFGIYNVVGGVVTMFSFLNSAMASATQRFLSFEIGKKNYAQLKRVFSMSINIHVIIALVIFILAETIGLWFLNAKLNIPAERMVAANWVYQFSILSFIIKVISVPYNAIIIARERMNIYAYVSILEVVLKLVIVFMLQWFGYDKLKFYAVLIFLVSLIIRLIFGFYCSRNFKESKYFFFWDKSLYKILMSYAGWNLWGTLASVMFTQGINILLNIFFGPAINAARGIAYRIRGAVNDFVSNFQIAMEPQIIKSFARGDKTYMHQLIFKGAKYSFFLLFILSLPIILETQIILKIWLKMVPDYTVIFTRLVLINVLIDCMSGPLITAAQASGKIKVYQSVVGGLLILILPISYIFLKLGYSPQVTLYVSISISILALFCRLWIIRPLVDLSIIKFTKLVLFPISMVVVIAVIPPLITKYFIDSGILEFFMVSIISVLSVMVTIYFIGLKNEERLFMKNKVMKYLAKRKSSNR